MIDVVLKNYIKNSRPSKTKQKKNSKEYWKFLMVSYPIGM